MIDKRREQSGEAAQKYPAVQAVPQGWLLVPVELLEKLAPESPINQDELGGCVWCAGTPPGEQYGYAGADPADHEHDCAWVVARALLNAPPSPTQQPELQRLTRDDTEHGVEYYRADVVDRILAMRQDVQEP